MKSAAVAVSSTSQTVLFHVSIFFPSQTNPPAAWTGIRLKKTLTKFTVYPAFHVAASRLPLGKKDRAQNVNASAKLTKGPTEQMIPVSLFLGSYHQSSFFTYVEP